MMSWIKRGDEPVSGAAAQDPDSPAALAESLADLVRTVNRNAGRFPVAAVVIARQVTDLVHEILVTTADDPVPDVQVIISVRGIVHDYLPTTLDRFLTLDPGTAGQPLANGRTPNDQLVEQLGGLWDAATDVLEAARAHDANELVTQGNFLRTKFSRSDLDL